MYGNKLKEIRKSISATQEQMADFLNISYRTYAAYERDENNPPYSMLVDLCTKYKINLNWFIADIGDMTMSHQNSACDILKSIIHDEVFRILTAEGLTK